MKKQLIKGRITIGYIAQEINTRTDGITGVYSFNTVLAQDYEDIELIISVSKTSAVPICSIIDGLNFAGKDNFKNIEINYTDEFWDTERHMTYVREHASGEFITYLRNTQAYYAPISVRDLTCCLKSDLRTRAVIGKRFVNKSSFDCGDMFNAIYRTKEVGPVRRAGESLLPKIWIKRVDIPYTSCYCPPEREAAKGGLFGGHEQLCAALQDGAEQRLNISLAARAERILNHIKQSGFKKSIPELMAELNWLDWKQRFTYWKMTDADKAYGNLLLRILSSRERKSGFIHRADVLKEIREKLHRQKEQKLRLVFFTQEYFVWPSMKSVYEAALNDDRFEADLVYVPFSHANGTGKDPEKEYRQYIDAGYAAIRWSEYDLRGRSPDVAFFEKPYDFIPKGFYIDEISTVIDKCVYIGYGIQVGIESDEFRRLDYCLPLHLIAWGIVCSGPGMYDGFCQNSYKHGSNCWRIGSPRIDAVRSQSSDIFAEEIKKRAGSRKVFLWNTHHTITKDGDLGTFLEYSNQLIEFAKQHDEIFILWRPHPLFFDALKNEMGVQACEDFWKDAEAVENILIDRQKDYFAAIQVSHAMISDISSLAAEYVLTEKPILITRRRDKENITKNNLINLLRTAYGLKGITDFIGDVIDERISVAQLPVSRQYYIPKAESVAERLLTHIWAEAARL